MSDSEFVRKDIYDKDLEIIAAELSSTEKRLDDIKDFISWGLGILGAIFVITQIGIGFLLYMLSTTP